MAGGMSLCAWWVMQTAWQSARQWDAPSMMDLLAMALACSGVLGVVLGAIQIFMPGWADGDVIARSATVGRAVGNLRQPNHLSTLLVLAACGSVWMGRRSKWSIAISVAVFVACIGGVVGTASRTGMVGMVLFVLWGWRDRGLPKPMRMVLLSTPLIYAMFWGGMWWWAQAGSGHVFAAQERLHDGSDISSSRFKIWADTLHLIGEQPWTGVGWGQFNLAWTLSEFPHRPIAFFDHTHNIVLQWAVELGIPMAMLLLVLCTIGLWPIFKVFIENSDAEIPNQRQGVRFTAACMLGMLALHSLLEYPLWYAYFLLPGAFAWGLGLAAQVGQPTHASDRSTAKWQWRLSVLMPSLIMVVGAAWCAIDYQSAVNIYEPSANAGPLDDRIATGRTKLWFGYQADYAWVTDEPEDSASLPPAAFHRTVRNLLDARLMVAYAKSLAEHGQVDKARYVAQRLNEFRHPMGLAFMKACDVPGTTEKPFQCTPPKQPYNWREVAP